MAKKAPLKKKNAKRRIQNTRSSFIWPLLLVLILVATLGGTAYFIFLSPGTAKISQARKAALKTGAEPSPIYQPIKPQIAYEEDALPELKIESAPRKTPQITANGKPRLALIIDDMGNRQQLGQQLIELDLLLSFAILPFTPHAHSLMEMAHAKNREILLHLPMEATSDKWDPGPGALTTAMTGRAIKAQVRKDLEDIPYAVGVNNHMGSKFTSNTEAMRAALAPIKSRNLFFLDSITIASSVAYKEAKALDIKTGRRDVFIDNEQDEAKIKAQLVRLVTIAKKHGSAIGIGHPYPATIAILEKEGAWLSEQVQLVSISSLME
ncbi:MAG: divergent polysaccharide deacetylase family protein [Proteobacteria bacterium]|nr:divergent polysaccharide deacetylase family protein [Pseudomonadota bacterium]MBU1641413.1 divergent polysaccharide deacetylase family protein [Pseudomonadota bacterium]